MSTNYYLHLKEPLRYKKPLREVADWKWEAILADPDQEVEISDDLKVHVAKTSWGWAPCFQAVPADNAFEETERNGEFYEIASMRDIRFYAKDGKHEIIDEYGDPLTWEEFEKKALNWCDYQKRHGFGGEFRWHRPGDALNAYVDEEGYQFCRTCFC